jgi:hypothetical protein
MSRELFSIESCIVGDDDDDNILFIFLPQYSTLPHEYRGQSIPVRRFRVRNVDSTVLRLPLLGLWGIARLTGTTVPTPGSNDPARRCEEQ